MLWCRLLPELEQCLALPLLWKASCCQEDISSGLTYGSGSLKEIVKTQRAYKGQNSSQELKRLCHFITSTYYCFSSISHYYYTSVLAVFLTIIIIILYLCISNYYYTSGTAVMPVSTADSIGEGAAPKGGVRQQTTRLIISTLHLLITVNLRHI